MNREIGRELKVSELRPRSVVVLQKYGRPCATWWVVEIGEMFVQLRAGLTGADFFAVRSGRNRERISDEFNRPMSVYEYLGETI
jgi:hypothetical protein